MRRFHYLSVICLAGAISLLSAQQPAESNLRIGVLDLEATGAADTIMGKSSAQKVAGFIAAAGGYELLIQDSIEARFAQIGKKFPRFCRDPRCVLSVGNSAKLDRIVYGSVDKGPSTFAVDLTLMDVMTRQVMEHVSIEAEPGSVLDDLLQTAVDRLLGREVEKPAAKSNAYFGPQVHNESEGGITTAAFLAIGMFWALVDGSLTGRDDNTNTVDFQYPDDPEALSGIATGIENVPVHGRPAGMANCYVGASDDAYGVHYNPAGMSWLTGRDVAVSYQYRDRFGLPYFAVAYANKATREIGFGHEFLYSGDSLLSETQFTTAWSYKFHRLLPFLKPLSLGVSLKVKSNKAKGSTESSVSGNAFGIGADWGLRWQLSDAIHYGLVVRNAPLALRWQNTLTDTAYWENQPTTLLMGGTFQAGYYTFLIAEGQIPLYADQSWQMAGGVEQEFIRYFKGRLGLRKEILSSLDQGWTGTVGFDIVVPLESVLGRQLNIDAALEYKQFEALGMAWNVSMRYSF